MGTFFFTLFLALVLVVVGAVYALKKGWLHVNIPGIYVSPGAPAPAAPTTASDEDVLKALGVDPTATTVATVKADLKTFRDAGAAGMNMAEIQRVVGTMRLVDDVMTRAKLPKDAPSSLKASDYFAGKAATLHPAQLLEEAILRADIEYDARERAEIRANHAEAREAKLAETVKTLMDDKVQHVQDSITRNSKQAQQISDLAAANDEIIDALYLANPDTKALAAKLRAANVTIKDMQSEINNLGNELKEVQSEAAAQTGVVGQAMLVLAKHAANPPQQPRLQRLASDNGGNGGGDRRNDRGNDRNRGNNRRPAQDNGGQPETPAEATT